MNADGDRAVIEQPAVLLIGLNVLGLLNTSERPYALATFQGDSYHRVLPTWLICTFHASARRARVSAPLSLPLKLNIPQLFLSLDSSTGLRHPQKGQSHVAFGLTMPETGEDG
jgi:hypothetical protein